MASGSQGVVLGRMVVLLLVWAGAATPAGQSAIDSGVAMVLIPSGSFEMGSTTGRMDEKPVHTVAIDAFYMDVYEVSQAHYRKIMEGRNPSRWKNSKAPVEQVWWTDAVRYCNARSEWEGLDPCYDDETWECNFDENGYRLPTEAEWEYACRAGSVGPFHFGDKSAKLRFFGWFRDNSGEKTHAVGGKKPNEWGLYDMCGNAWEWCNDTYDVASYQAGSRKDPKGARTGHNRVLRGGSCADRAEECRSAARNSEPQSPPDACVGFNVFGFRCVRRVAP